MDLKQPRKPRGGGVTAKYEDALRFIDNQTNEDAEKSVRGSEAMMLVFGLIVPASRLDAGVDVIAFVYGKTPAQVKADLLLMKEREESRR